MAIPAFDPANPPAAFRPAWRLGDAAINRDAIAFWDRNNMLPAAASLEERLAQVVAGAYDGDKMIAIATANIREVDFLRARLAMFRCSVDRETRERRLATAISLYAFDVLERWSLAHPDEQLMGVGAVIQSRALVEHDNHAVWPDTKLTFVGYTNEGYQFRVRWFAHGTIPRFWPGEPGAQARL
jgi:hypothetical protein